MFLLFWMAAPATIFVRTLLKTIITRKFPLGFKHASHKYTLIFIMFSLWRRLIICLRFVTQHTHAIYLALSRLSRSFNFLRLLGDINRKILISFFFSFYLTKMIFNKFIYFLFTFLWLFSFRFINYKPLFFSV